MTFIMYDKPTKGRGSVKQEPVLKILKSGQISLNKYFVEKFQLQEGCFVQLGYDPDDHRVGVKLLKKRKNSGSLRLFTKGAKNRATINAAGFFKTFKIDYKNMTNRKFDVDINAEEKILVVRP